MKGIFSVESPLNKGLTVVADLMLVNFLFLLFSLPIVTIGASLTAMNSVTLKLTRKEQPSILKNFWESFKENLKQATILWFLTLGMGAVLFAWYIVIENLIYVEMASIFRIFLYIFMVLFTIMIIYVFFLQAMFTNKIISTIKNSLILSIKHLFFSFLSILIIFMGIFITIFYPKIVGYGIIVVLIGFSLTSYCIAFLMNRVFQPYR